MGKGENPHMKTVSDEDIGFEPVAEGYSLPIISPYDSLVHLYRRDQFPSRSDFARSRSHFQSLGAHAQNTLFHPKHIRKFRGREVLEKFVIFAELKSAGNCEYRKGDYSKALSIHEQIYGLFRYLEPIRENDDAPLTSVTDSDYEYHSTVAASPSEDKLLRDMLATTLLNMAACALKLSSFVYAAQLCTEAVEVQPEYSLAYARRAQSVIVNLGSSAAELEKAGEDAERALQLDPKKEYSALRAKARERIAAEEEKERAFFADFFQSVTKFGRIDLPPQSDELELEHQLIQKMHEKYLEMLKFYEDCEKRDKLTAVRQEMQTVTAVLRRMDWIQGIDAKRPSAVMAGEAEKAGVDLKAEGVGNVIECVKRMSISTAFSGPKYNDQLMKYCIDICTAEGLRRQRLRESSKPQQSWCSWWLLALLGGFSAWAWYYWSVKQGSGIHS